MTESVVDVASVAVAEAIAARLRQSEGAETTLLNLRAMPLLEGSVARSVRRLDAQILLPDGSRIRRSFVQKYTVPREIAISRLLQPLATRCAISKPLADGVDLDGTWLLMPFIEGVSLRDQYLLPPDVLSTLIGVHGAFADRLDELGFLPQLNGEFWRGLLALSDEALAKADWQPSEKERLASELKRLRASETVPRALLSLPQTLTHSDVHGGNMIIASPPDGRTYLIDWGNARVGPAAVDLANCVSSARDLAWIAYWARAAADGRALSERDQQISLLASRAQINVQYLPYAIGALGHAHSARMAETALRCQTALG